MTDIVDSTELWDRAPVQMREALARHDQLFDQAVTAFQGFHLKPRGEGDSRFAVFIQATDAVAAAVAITEAMAEEEWELPARLRLRVGLHTGEAFLRDGDYYGSDVNRCARIRGLARPGQILCSKSTADYVRYVLPEGVRLHNRGVHELRGLSRPVAVFEIEPPIKTTESRFRVGTARTIRNIRAFLRRHRTAAALVVAVALVGATLFIDRDGDGRPQAGLRTGASGDVGSGAVAPFDPLPSTEPPPTPPPGDASSTTVGAPVTTSGPIFGPSVLDTPPTTAAPPGVVNGLTASEPIGDDSSVEVLLTWGAPSGPISGYQIRWTTFALTSCQSGQGGPRGPTTTTSVGNMTIARVRATGGTGLCSSWIVWEVAAVNRNGTGPFATAAAVVPQVYGQTYAYHHVRAVGGRAEPGYQDDCARSPGEACHTRPEAGTEVWPGDEVTIHQQIGT